MIEQCDFSYADKRATGILDSFLKNSTGSGLSLDTASVTTDTSESASLNLGEMDHGPFVKKTWTTSSNKSIRNKDWRSSYGNCHTICTRILRRPSMSMSRQLSLRDVTSTSIPEDRIAEEEDDSEFLFSRSMNELFLDPVDAGILLDSTSVSTASTNCTSSSKWKDSVMSRRSKDYYEEEDDDDNFTVNEGKSVRSILSVSSSRLLELPRDVEFDSGDSSDSDEDDLSADWFDAKWYHQKVRHW